MSPIPLIMYTLGVLGVLLFVYLETRRLGESGVRSAAWALMALVTILLGYCLLGEIARGCRRRRARRIAGLSGSVGGRITSVSDGCQVFVLAVTQFEPDDENRAASPETIVGQNLLISVQHARDSAGQWEPLADQVEFVRALAPGTEITVNVECQGVKEMRGLGCVQLKRGGGKKTGHP